jgi:hypothetical protein
MTLTISPKPSVTRQTTRPKIRPTSRTGSAGLRPKTAPHVRAERGPGRNEPGLLNRYADLEGRLRQLIALPGAGGSVLVVDRDAVTLGDRRLVAHLAADEPRENAAVVCDHYIQNPAGRWCRAVTQEDLEVVPFADAGEIEPQTEVSSEETALIDKQGRTYRLELGSAGMSIPEMRWYRCSPAGEEESSESISMREAIAGLESYEPVRMLTHKALALHRNDPQISVAVLRAECARMDVSQIVLNRGLREAVLSAAAAQGLSMSEIAVRCGRVKYDSRGKESGETSWLARRLGIVPEGGESVPTPWIHSDVLALIARCGLGISPREVELG